MSDTRVKVESFRERIQDSNDMTDEDREVLLQCSDAIYLLKSEYTDIGRQTAAALYPHGRGGWWAG